MPFGAIAGATLEPVLVRWKHRLVARMHRRSMVSIDDHDLQQIDLFQILRWSPKRPLDPSRHTVVRDLGVRAPQSWFPDDVLAAEVAAARSRVSGVVCEVSAYSVDHGESGEPSKGLRLSVRSSHYPDSLAVQKLCADDQLWPPIRRLFVQDGARRALAVAPAQSFFIALTLTTGRGEVLKTRRASAAVASAGGQWSLGVCETMNAIPTHPGHEPENVFALAQRAANEELGLRPQDCGPIWFTWFGFSRFDGPFIVAHVRTSLSMAEVTARVLQAEGGYEADALGWLSVGGHEHRELAKVVVHAGWLPLTPVVAQGLLDVWTSLEVAPIRP